MANFISYSQKSFRHLCIIYFCAEDCVCYAYTTKEPNAQITADPKCVYKLKLILIK